MTTPTIPITPTTPTAVSTAARTSTSSFWSRDVYDLVALACVLFVVLTAVAMLLYPGGTIMDPDAKGYRFFEDYLSDLGQTYTPSGAVNFPAMLFWIIAMVSVALAVAAFFLAFTRLVAASAPALWLSRCAAFASVVTCVGFIGIAAAPKDLGSVIYVQHITFEWLAFFSFLGAVLFEIAALRALERTAPPGLQRRFLWVFVGFVAALLVYIAVVCLGPNDMTLAGERTQATGQKLIVLASLTTIFVQSLQARRLASRPTASQG